MPRKVSTEILDRKPPSDDEAELGILGAVLLKPDVVDDVEAIVRSGDFYDDANRKLYANIEAMHVDGRKIDRTLLIAELRKSGDFEAIGGAAYIDKVLRAVPNAAHAEHYARIVADESRKRQVIHAATDILQDAFRDDRNAADVLGSATAALEAIDSGTDQATVDSKTAVLDAARHVRDVFHQGKRLGLTIGLPQFDRLIGGLFPGELIVLAARPGMGKTSLALQIMHHVTAGGHATLFATVEMSYRELMIRLICGKAGVNSKAVRTAELTEGDVIDFENQADTMIDAPFVLLDKPELTVADVRREARRLHRGDGLEMTVVDYLGRLKTDDPRLPRHEQVGRMSGALKELARELNIPVLVLAQLNREIEGRGGGRPKLSHLRESGSIEQDADVVMFIDRPEVREPSNTDLRGKATLTIAKNRNGETGAFPLVWDGSRTMFKTAAPERYDCFNSHSDGSDMGGYGFDPNREVPA